MKRGRPLLLWLALLVPLHALPSTAQQPAAGHAVVFDGLKARAIGPANMSGRITDIAVVESNPNVMYVAAATGGVWKTSDGGKHWAAVFDQAGSLCIGAVCVSQSHPDVVWVGTGEGNVLR